MFFSYLKRKAQAAAEMAIFGSLLILVFSFILSYIQNANDSQFITMEAFRRALQKANHENAVVNYSVLRTPRNVDLNTPIKGVRSQNSASSAVYWAVPFVGTQPVSKSYYRINNQELDDEDLVIEDIESVDIIAKEKAEEMLSKEETEEFISTVRSVNVDDEVQFVFKDENGLVLKEVNQVLTQSGKYKKKSSVLPGEEGLERKRRWTSPFWEESLENHR